MEPDPNRVSLEAWERGDDEAEVTHVWRSFKKGDAGVKHDRYTVNFGTMKQKNPQSGKEREVRAVAWKSVPSRDQ